MQLPEGEQVCSRCGIVGERYITRFTAKGILSITCEPCNDQRQFEEYSRTGRFTSSLMLTATLMAYNSTRYAQPNTPMRVLDQARALDATVKRLRVLVKQFERDVWYGGASAGSGGPASLQAVTRATRTRALSCEMAVPAAWGRPVVADRRVAFLSYCLAGRCMMTVKAKRCEVTVITAEDEPPGPTPGARRKPDEGPMGPQSVYGTEAQATTLLQAAITAWKAGLLILRADPEVFML